MEFKDILSLGIRTNTMIHQFDGGIVEEHDDCIVIKTPSNPNYWWGNYLIMPAPPQVGDFEGWEQLFQRRLGTDFQHRVFAWDINPANSLKPIRGEDADFVSGGFNRYADEVLATKKEGLKRPEFVVQELEVRPLESSKDWADALEINVLCREPHHPEGSYREHRRKQLEMYQRLQADDIGAIFGGFLDGKLVADMGLFIENGLGRFQHVETHPDYRKRGIAGTMVHHISEWGFNKRDAEYLVIIADPEGPAVKLYKSLGYSLQEISYSLEKPSYD